MRQITGNIRDSRENIRDQEANSIFMGCDKSEGMFRKINYMLPARATIYIITTHIPCCLMFQRETGSYFTRKV